MQEQPPGVFCKKGVLRNCVKFTGKQLCQSIFFNKSQGIFFTEHLWAAASVHVISIETEILEKRKVCFCFL